MLDADLLTESVVDDAKGLTLLARLKNVGSTPAFGLSQVLRPEPVGWNSLSQRLSLGKYIW